MSLNITINSVGLVLVTKIKKLSGSKKDILIWNWMLGFSMYLIQELMREKNMEDISGVTT